MGFFESARKMGIDLRKYRVTTKGLEPIGGVDDMGIGKIPRRKLWQRISNSNGTGSGYKTKKLNDKGGVALIVFSSFSQKHVDLNLIPLNFLILLLFELEFLIEIPLHIPISSMFATLN